MANRLALLGLLLAAALHAADEPPPWLSALTKLQLPPYDNKVSTVVLLDEEQTTAADSGKFTTTSRRAVKVLVREDARVVFADQYFTGSGKIRDFRAWMIAPSGKVKKYGKDEIADIACVDNDVYNECRSRVVSGKRDAEVGGIFAYESVVEYQSFTSQLSFHFQEASPVRTARLVLTVPAGWEVKSSSFNGAPSQPAVSGNTYTWQMEDLAALKPEPSSPSSVTLAPWVGINLLGPGANRPVLSWPDAARLLNSLNSGDPEPSGALAAKARSLVAGANSEMAKIAAIGRFTQQVKYVSIQVNIARGGGYKPHPSAQTFEKLYGDCKDKANLTRAMLKAVGITAYPVAIFSGDRTHVTAEWPSLGRFNHAISAIRVGPETRGPAVLDDPRFGRLLFFDPTDAYVSPGYLPGHEQASLALIATADGGDLIRVPAGQPAAAGHARDVEATLTADGGLQGTFTDTRSGEELGSAVATYRGNTRTDYTKYIERWVGGSIPGAATSAIEIGDKEDAFTVKATFASPRFAQRPQTGMMIFKAALLAHADLRLTEKTRKHPLVVDTDALRENVRIALPAGFKVDELPTAVKIDSAYGKYEATWKVDNGTLLFQRTFELPAQTIPPAKYEEFKQFLDRVTNAGDAPVVLIK